MSNESNLCIAAKKKALIGRQLRKSMGPRIAEALGIHIEGIQFTDEPQTSELGAAFAQGMQVSRVHAFPNRIEALVFVQNHSQALTVAGVWLVDDFHLTGAVELDLLFALVQLDVLLRSQNEFVRLLTVDGTHGLCISSEEGKEDCYERHVVIW